MPMLDLKLKVEGFSKRSGRACTARHTSACRKNLARKQRKDKKALRIPAVPCNAAPLQIGPGCKGSAPDCQPGKGKELRRVKPRMKNSLDSDGSAQGYRSLVKPPINSACDSPKLRLRLM